MREDLGFLRGADRELDRLTAMPNRDDNEQSIFSKPGISRRC